MSITIKENKKPNLKLPKFSVDNELHIKLNNYEITKLMNKSNFSLFLGKAGSGKTSLMTSFLKTKDLFHKVYYQIFIFMPSNSRASLKDNFFDKSLPEEQIFSDVQYEDLNEVYLTCQANAEDKKQTLIIFDDTQRFLKQNDIQKLLLNMINNRRHLRLSIWLCCQNYFSIPKMVRSGLTDLFVFKCSKKEMEQIFEEQIELYKDYFLEIKNSCFKKNHDFLYINTNSGKIFNNWNEIVITF
jgi:replication-associated recombination protein RarA